MVVCLLSGQIVQAFSEKYLSLTASGTNVTEKLLTVSSCKNLKKYFAIKSIISLFRAAMQQAATSFMSSILITRTIVAGVISVIIISITGITG